MKEAALILIKPDGMTRGLVGTILNKFEESGLELVALKIAKATRELAEEHYLHIQKEPYFEEVMSYIMGEFHGVRKLLSFIYYGEDAIKKCRKMAGATNPEEADPRTIRGSFGRVTTKGLFENVVHVSSDKKEAEREIKIWFEPDDITVKLYPYQTIEIKSSKRRIWK